MDGDSERRAASEAQLAARGGTEGGEGEKEEENGEVFYLIFL